MKTFILSIAAILLLFIPEAASADWYWLNNAADPDRGEFVQLSALEYAETDIPKNLLIAIDEELVEIIDDADDFEECESKHEGIISNLKESSPITQLQESLIRQCVESERVEDEKLDAVRDCDLEFIDKKLSSSEKVTHHKEIAECREALAEITDMDVEISEIVTTVEIATPALPNISQDRSTDSVIEQAIDEGSAPPLNDIDESMADMGNDGEVAETGDKAESPGSLFAVVIQFFKDLFTW